MQLYLQGFKPPDEGPSEYQSIPLNKIEDFGVHCKQWVVQFDWSKVNWKGKVMIWRMPCYQDDFYVSVTTA